MDCCLWFLMFLIALTAVTVVGHLIWLALAALSRNISGEPLPADTSREPASAATQCVLCWHKFSARRAACPACGLHRHRSEAVQLGELETAYRQVETLLAADHIAADAADVVLNSLGRQRRRLIERLNVELGRRKEGEPAVAPSLAIVLPDDIPTALLADEPARVAAPPVLAVEEPPPVPVVVTEPPPPRRTFGEMMAAFMEERNILWGEVVGGLLIVGCSIALVISLRETLEAIPYFPFLIVGAVAAALIGAGRYTLSHWKLEATSRGLLVIGTMLVPLAFTVLAGLAGDREHGTLEIVIEIAALALFTWLVRGAANILVRQPVGAGVPRADWLTTVAILGAAASLLVVPHLDVWGYGLIAYAPAALFVLTQGIAWFAAYRRERLTARQAGGLFLGLGLSAYAVAVAFVFVAYRSADVGQALECLAVPMALAGLPLLVGGTIAAARLRGPEDESEPSGLSRPVAGLIATLVSLTGTLVMLLALGAAWPHPVRLTVIGAVNGIVLAFVANRFRLTPAYAVAQVCLAVAALTGFHVLAGHLDANQPDLGRQLVAAWVSPASSVVLLVYAGLLAAAAEWQARIRRMRDSRYLFYGAGVAVLASLGLVAVAAEAEPGRAACVFGAAAGGAWLVNVRRRSRSLTVVAAAVLVGSNFFYWHLCDPQGPLMQAVVVGLQFAAFVMVFLASFVRLRILQPKVQWAFVPPLEWSALVASVAASVVLVPALRWDLGIDTAMALGCGVIWLVLAVQWQRAELFVAFQAALVVAVLFVCVHVLQMEPWFTNDARGLFGDMRSWHSYGIGVSVLALAWVAARFGLRRSPDWWALAEPGWPAGDRLLLVGAVVFAALVTVAGVAPGVAAELTPVTAAPAAVAVLHVQGPLGWCWLGVLSLAFGLTLWQGWARHALPALTAVVLCAGVMAAATFADQIAVASAVRWVLALGFVAISALLWLRRRLAASASAAGVRWEDGAQISTLVRILLLVGAAAPLGMLTVSVAALGFARLQPAGPLAGSWFAEVGLVVNNLGPLVLLCVGLAGHGVRERSSGYAFAAGLVALVAVIGGDALGIITSGGTLGPREGIQLGQLVTAVTAAWLIGWLLIRRGLGVAPLLRRGLLAVQDALTAASPCCWLVPALALLAFPHVFSLSTDDALAVQQEAGSWLGWLVVGLAVVAGIAYHQAATRALPSYFLGLAAVLVVGVGCCTVTLFAPTWGQRVLMLASALLSLGFALTLVRWSVASASVTELLFFGGVGGFAVLLALQRATADDWYWAAAAVGIVAAAAAVVAWLRRVEEWAFVGGALALVAASLVLCGTCSPAPSATWIVLLFQVNLATAGVVGLVWLYFLPRISPSGCTGGQVPSWLGAHQGLAFFGNVVLLVLGLGGIILVPDTLPLVLAIGGVAGWLALLPAAAGMVWLVRLATPRHTVRALASIGLLAGVLLACTATHLDLGAAWLGRYMLMISWLLTAAGIVAAAWVKGAQRRPSISWAVGIGVAVALAAFFGGLADPYRPYGPCAELLAVSVLAGALALWTHRRRFVYASGLLFNVAGLLAWVVWMETPAQRQEASPLYRFVLVQVICLATASLVWSVLKLAGRWKFRPSGQSVPPFRHLAAWIALGLLAMAVGWTLLADLSGSAGSYHPILWFALIAVLTACSATLADRPGRRWAAPLPQLYALGLVFIGALLHQLQLAPQWLAWSIGVALGPYSLLMAIGCHFALTRRLARWPLAWLVPAQAALSVVVSLLAVWVCLSFADLGPRLAAFGTVACLVPAWTLLVPPWGRLMADWRFSTDARVPRNAALLLAVVAAACLAVAFVAPDTIAPWLHRSVLLLAAVTFMLALFGHGLPRLLPAGDGWSAAARRLATPLGLTACGLLLLVLAQEFVLYNPDDRRTPLALYGIVVVSAALVVLIGTLLTFALWPAHDLLRLSERRRTLHVYAAEVLLVALVVHLRLTAADIFPSFIGKYWIFVVMAVAFLGVGLSELCQRRGLRVLADPLQRTAMFLPVLPLLAFLIRPLGELRHRADSAVAGIQPWTRYLDRLPDSYTQHATIWFLMGALYLIVALTRRSSHLGLAAAVLANFGLWVLWGHNDDLTFFAHPQLWLIPIGLIVLAAEHLNRDRLTAAQVLGLRYAGLLMIYLSSTADLFITGLGSHVELPIILALLSVAGVLVGILLRVRAFLFLGVTFLFLVVFSQIWHAAVDRAQTWVWWASGIVLGVAILTLFALFEKRRADVLKMIDEVKGWR